MLDQLKEISPDKPQIKGRLRKIERVTLRHAHRFLIRRMANLRDVQRHALGWVILVLSLSLVTFWQSNAAAETYTTDVPSETGVFAEGTFGALDNINPLFASTSAERAASSLLFANLLTRDNKGDLVGELAQSWQVDKSGRNYDVKLRSNAVWHDGQPLTADDVVFTFNLIKNADTRSPLYTSWRNIGIKKIDNLTVRFTLPVSYAAFADSLTIGILPRHILREVRPSELRTENYNRSPQVASGVFKFQDLRSVNSGQTQYLLRMTANPAYVLGEPKVNSFHLYAYKDSEDLTRAFRVQEIASFSDASISQINSLGDSDFKELNSPLFNGVYAFLKMDSPTLSNKNVRKALQLSTDSGSIVSKLGNKVQTLNGPILPGQLGYNAGLKAPKTNINKAKELLNKAGWRENKDGERQKDGQNLRLQLLTVSNGDYPAVAEELMRQWREIGVQFDSLLVKPEDIQQNNIIPRAYDVLIYEIAIGRDPDVYAYWHSSQATQRGLNLSNYRSAISDDALDSARTRLNPALRQAKYELFVKQWLDDVPAIGLYRPALLYAENNNVTTFEPRPLVDATDRYFNVGHWSAGNELLRPTR